MLKKKIDRSRQSAYYEKSLTAKDLEKEEFVFNKSIIYTYIVWIGFTLLIVFIFALDYFRGGLENINGTKYSILLLALVAIFYSTRNGSPSLTVNHQGFTHTDHFMIPWRLVTEQRIEYSKEQRQRQGVPTWVVYYRQANSVNDEFIKIKLNRFDYLPDDVIKVLRHYGATL